jgi:hypothetical protein
MHIDVGGDAGAMFAAHAPWEGGERKTTKLIPNLIGLAIIAILIAAFALGLGTLAISFFMQIPTIAKIFAALAILLPVFMFLGSRFG